MESTLVSARATGGEAGGSRFGAGADRRQHRRLLINSAFDFVLSEHTLPGARQKAPKGAADFQAFCTKSTLDVDWGAEDSGLRASRSPREGPPVMKYSLVDACVYIDF